MKYPIHRTFVLLATLLAFTLSGCGVGFDSPLSFGSAANESFTSTLSKNLNTQLVSEGLTSAQAAAVSGSASRSVGASGLAMIGERRGPAIRR